MRDGASARWIIALGIAFMGAPGCKKDAPAPSPAPTAGGPKAAAGATKEAASVEGSKSPEGTAVAEKAAPAKGTAEGEKAAPAEGEKAAPAEGAAEGEKAAAVEPKPADPPAGGSPAPPGPTVIVAGESGIRVVAADGSALKTLRAGAARWPRRLPGGAGVLFLVPETWELRRIGLDGTGEALVARLPDPLVTCPAADGEEAVTLRATDLSVQSDEDFAVTAAGDAACLRLADRNANMADQTVELRVALATGALSLRVELPDGCGPPSDAPVCAWPVPPAIVAPPAHPFDVVDGNLVRRSGGATTVVSALGGAQDFSVDARSPSGRWVAVSGLISEGDYIHRSLFLLDADGGMLRPVVAGAWPDPLPVGGLAALGEEGPETADVVGESTIAWVGDDLLRVDALLVVPEKGGVQIDGDIAP